MLRKVSPRRVEVFPSLDLAVILATVPVVFLESMLSATKSVSTNVRARTA